MTDFILEGHFARHLKRMRAHYAERQAFLCELIERRLGGLLETRPLESGMYLMATLPRGWDDASVSTHLAGAGITATPLSSLTLATRRPPALVLGYAGHDKSAMERAAERMAYALDTETGLALLTGAELV
jgi:GntR family transcriptional regulator/MocR family aminotransferase